MSNDYELFVLNCNYYFQMSYKDNIDFYSRSKSVKKTINGIKKTNDY